MTTVAGVIADGLARAGTPRVFAVTSGDGGPLLEAVPQRGLAVVRVPRADMACVMAAVSGGLEGTPGAVVIDDGAGEVTDGLVYAASARAPLVLIDGRSSMRTGSRPVAKASLPVAPSSAAHWIAHACRLAMTEPWGPVHLHVPASMASTAALPVATNCRPSPLPAPDAGALDAAVRRLEASEHPLVVVGRLCRSEADAAWIRAFAEARPAPVLATPNGRGVVPDPHPLLIGILDGGDVERRLLASADLVVAIGVDPMEAAAAWPAWMPVIELTPVAPETPSPDRVAVVGDVGLILEELAPRLRDRRLGEWDVARLHASKQGAAAPPTDARRLAAHRVVEAARRLTPAGAVAVFEGGDLWPTAARAWHAVAPGECVGAARGDTQRFSVVAAAAAQLARPQGRVVCFTDASKLQADHLGATAALGVPVPIVVAGHADVSALGARAGLRCFTASPAAFTSVFERALAAGVPALVAAGLEE